MTVIMYDGRRAPAASPLHNDLRLDRVLDDQPVRCQRKPSLDPVDKQLAESDVDIFERRERRAKSWSRLLR